MIAALFVETNGAYFGIEGVDPWDITRDARKYTGPHPVVAHPPCQLWVNFAALNYKRWGGEHNRPGNDGGCFESALGCVRLWGGVLEHPAGSNAWSAYGLGGSVARAARRQAMTLIWLLPLVAALAIFRHIWRVRCNTLVSVGCDPGWLLRRKLRNEFEARRPNRRTIS